MCTLQESTVLVITLEGNFFLNFLPTFTYELVPQPVFKSSKKESASFKCTCFLLILGHGLFHFLLDRYVNDLVRTHFQQNKILRRTFMV